ncbi:HIT-like domain-containing protein [Xylariaceae sp. FL0804]|nr:HIT-like domain-containing protein [Xylariaceae sp. FL0804]
MIRRGGGLAAAAAFTSSVARASSRGIISNSSGSREKMTITTHAAPEPSPAAAGPSRPYFFGPFEVTSQVFLTTAHSFALVNLKPLLPGHVLVCPRRPHRRLTDLAAAELTDLFCAVQRVQRMLAARYFTPAAAAGERSGGAGGGRDGVSSNGAETAAGGGEVAGPEAGSFNIAVQDGAGAGQTVPHVHVHVIPRIRGATAKDDDGPGDEIYEHMAGEAGNVGGALWDRDDEVAATAAAAAAVTPPRGLGSRPRPGGAFPRIEEAERRPRPLDEMEAEAAAFREVLRRMEQ